MNKYKGILDYNAQSKTMTPRTDAVCDEFAPSCKNPPFHYIANHARELEKECVYLKKSLEALYKELHSEQERRVIAQEGCMKLDAIMSAIVAAMPNTTVDEAVKMAHEIGCTVCDESLLGEFTITEDGTDYTVDVVSEPDEMEQNSATMGYYNLSDSAWDTMSYDQQQALHISRRSAECLADVICKPLAVGRSYRDASMNPVDYDAIEIHGVRDVEFSHGQVGVEVDDDNPEYFSVYWHKKTGGVECVGDYPKYADALMVAKCDAAGLGWPLHDCVTKKEPNGP